MYLDMNRLSHERRAQVIGCLVEGNSIRATCRMTGTAKATVLKLLAEVGEVCREYQDKHVRNLQTHRVQCDEIWSFCHAKEKNVPAENKGQFGYGDVWTWTSIDADSKLVISWCIGGRDSYTGLAFMQDVASTSSRTAARPRGLLRQDRFVPPWSAATARAAAIDRYLREKMSAAA